MKTVRSKNFDGFLTISASVGLGLMLSAAAFGQGRFASASANDAAQKQRVEQLIAENAEAWSRHDIARIVSFFDPSLVLVDADGKHTSYAEWRQNLPALFARERNLQTRITIRAVKGVGNGT